MQGAARSTLLAASPLLDDGATRKYIEDCVEVAPFQDGTRSGVKDYALDHENVRKLWELSVQRIEVHA